MREGEKCGIRVLRSGEVDVAELLPRGWRDSLLRAAGVGAALVCGKTIKPWPGATRCRKSLI